MLNICFPILQLILMEVVQLKIQFKIYFAAI